MGTSTLTLSTVNSYTGGTNVSAGKLIIAAAGALPASSSVSITGGTLQLAPGTGAETLSSLSITAGNLDIGNNHFILSYAAGAQTATDAAIRGYLVSGRNGGGWNGSTGIISTGSSGTGVAAGYSIGYADGADHVVTGLSSGQIEVKYTLLGDANLDGLVTGDDFTILVGNLGKAVSGWDKGDFLYTGLVTGDDFTALVGNLGKSATGADVVLPASDYAAVDAFATANGLNLTATVPEPATFGLFGVVAGAVLARRRAATRMSRGLSN
jgi:autotransporter-associated beta strand protein